jgi:hypothetical protein
MTDEDVCYNMSVTSIIFISKLSAAVTLLIPLLLQSVTRQLGTAQEKIKHLTQDLNCKSNDIAAATNKAELLTLQLGQAQQEITRLMDVISRKSSKEANTPKNQAQLLSGNIVAASSCGNSSCATTSDDEQQQQRRRLSNSSSAASLPAAAAAAAASFDDKEQQQGTCVANRRFEFSAVDDDIDEYAQQQEGDWEGNSSSSSGLSSEGSGFSLDGFEFGDSNEWQAAASDAAAGSSDTAQMTRLASSNVVSPFANAAAAADKVVPQLNIGGLAFPAHSAAADKVVPQLKISGLAFSPHSAAAAATTAAAHCMVPTLRRRR